MTMEFTAEEIREIRSALCDRSMKALSKVLEVEKEEQEKGLDNSTSEIFKKWHDLVRNTISKIDAIQEAQ